MGKKNVFEIPAGKICIYGTRSGGYNAFHEITKARQDVQVVCFVDSFKEGEFLDLPMYTLPKLLRTKINYDYILVASAFSFEIGLSMVKHGITDYVRFFFTWDEEPNPRESHSKWEKRYRENVYFIGQDGRLRLPQLDLNLTEHCNLNCAGCNHFCPLADKWFYSPMKAESELAQLKKYVGNVDRIFIVGGEPLLNPQVEDFFCIVHKFFPNAVQTLWTNGTLLKRMPESFWEKCREYQVDVRFTNYPQLRHRAPELARLIREKLGSFYGFDREDCCLMLTDREVPNKSLSRCGLPIITLSRGKIYHCPYEAYIHIYNKRFGTKFPERQGYDIFASTASVQGLQDHLVTPSAMCRNCRDKDNIVLVDWSSASEEPDAWVLRESK